MIHENLNEVIDPKHKKEDEGATEEGYDILPSNGPGLAGDDGEQVVDGAEVEGVDDDEGNNDDEENDD